MAKIISELLDQDEVNGLFAKLEAAPDIPQDKRGIKFYSTCTCGGTITAMRSTYNGHYRAACDKCEWRMME